MVIRSNMNSQESLKQDPLDDRMRISTITSLARAIHQQSLVHRRMRHYNNGRRWKLSLLKKSFSCSAGIKCVSQSFFPLKNGDIKLCLNSIFCNIKTVSTNIHCSDCFYQWMLLGMSLLLWRWSQYKWIWGTFVSFIQMQKLITNGVWGLKAFSW